MRGKTYLALVYAAALLTCLWALSACTSLPAPVATACNPGEPQELACLQRENAMLRRQLSETEADVTACSNYLRECLSACPAP